MLPSHAQLITSLLISCCPLWSSHFLSRKLHRNHFCLSAITSRCQSKCSHFHPHFTPPHKTCFTGFMTSSTSMALLPSACYTSSSILQYFSKCWDAPGHNLNRDLSLLILFSWLCFASPFSHYTQSPRCGSEYHPHTHDFQISVSKPLAWAPTLLIHLPMWPHLDV